MTPYRYTSLLLATCFWLVVYSSSIGAQQEDRLPATVAKALKSAGIAPGGVSIVVQEAGAPRSALSINATQPSNPASLMKLLTTYAALELLGPAYTWRTELWSAGKLADGVLEGDLILKGGGDPRLTLEQFWLLLRQLRARGVRDIRGDLVLDRTWFDASGTTGSGTEPEIIDNQLLRPYNVVPDPLLLNFKALRVQFIADADSKNLLLTVDPQPLGLDVINLVKPADGPCGDWREALRADLTRPHLAGGNQRLVITGRYPLECGEKSWNLGVLSHPQYVGGVFRQLWHELGGTLTGATREAALAGARRLASIESPTLAEIIRDINKFSNNVMARQLFLTLGVHALTDAPRGDGSRAPRLADADAAVRAWLTQHELRFPELVIENGSGLSRRERISADSLARLLQVAWNSPLMPEFVASLPLSGSDGTLRKRLKQNGIAGRTHLKTGSLDGVKCIAGYVLDRAGKWQIVVFMINHANAAAGQAAQDALVQWVYERGV